MQYVDPALTEQRGRARAAGVVPTVRRFSWRQRGTNLFVEAPTLSATIDKEERVETISTVIDSAAFRASFAFATPYSTVFG